MSKYDTFVFGSPTWGGNPTPFMKVFIDKAKNINGKKAAVFGTGMSPIEKRDHFIEIMKNNLENAGIKTIDNYLFLNFSRGQIKDGEQNIDNFVNNIIK